MRLLCNYLLTFPCVIIKSWWEFPFDRVSWIHTCFQFLSPWCISLWIFRFLLHLMITTIVTIMKTMISTITDRGTIIARSVDVVFFFPLNSEPAWLVALLIAGIIWVPILASMHRKTIATMIKKKAAYYNLAFPSGLQEFLHIYFHFA